MRTKNLTYILRCKKNNRFKIYEMKKKLVKSLFNVCHCSCCWCCDNNIGHCKLLSCKNLQWTMVEKSKKISSQLMHDENIFFPCSFAVFILPIWINFGILKELFLQIIGAQRTIFNTRNFILLVSYILLIILFLSLVTYTYFEVKWYLKVRLTTLTIYFSNFVLQIFTQLSIIHDLDLFLGALSIQSHKITRNWHLWKNKIKLPSKCTFIINMWLQNMNRICDCHQLFN